MQLTRVTLPDAARVSALPGGRYAVALHVRPYDDSDTTYVSLLGHALPSRGVDIADDPVVRDDGALMEKLPGGRARQAKALAAEGVAFEKQRSVAARVADVTTRRGCPTVAEGQGYAVSSCAARFMPYFERVTFDLRHS